MSLRASGLYHGLQAPLLPILMAYVSDEWSLVVIVLLLAVRIASSVMSITSRGFCL
jgi:hypothetical protein